MDKTILKKWLLFEFIKKLIQTIFGYLFIGLSMRSSLYLLISYARNAGKSKMGDMGVTALTTKSWPATTGQGDSGDSSPILNRLTLLEQSRLLPGSVRRCRLIFLDGFNTDVQCHRIADKGHVACKLVIAA